MAKFTIYLDASGNPDTEVLCIAGFVATAEQWIRIELLWKRVLAKYEVTELHMKWFAHSSREYSLWKGDEKKRAAFLSELIAVIQSRVRHSFACSIYMPDYRQANTADEIRSIMSPLALVGGSLVRRVQAWADHVKSPQEKLLFMIEDGDIDKGNLMRWVKQYCGVDLIPMKKSKSVAFQAADLLAYEHYKFGKKALKPVPEISSRSEVRKSLMALTSIACGKNMSDWNTLSGAKLVSDLELLKEAIRRARSSEENEAT